MQKSKKLEKTNHSRLRGKRMKILLLSIFLVGCVDIPDTFEVNHTTSLDQCKDHGGREFLDVLTNRLVCKDGAWFNLFKD